ncbi:N-acetyltransferase [Actinoplanes capillaceus]|uniref:N-acetyltransferase n=1 Tax=Actinoplanes campanulatus TaxID=113559 RepID=A0ABQ3WH83_9ACTN|nr:GNAT family N-acetyltransferase [Actinoplanes capillaceus]GID45599.1 N-acetyltransferase [Actinoplanes capillaceus]
MRWRPWLPNTRPRRSANPRRAHTFPDLVLRTDRLVLRELRESDAGDVVAGASDEITQRWLPLPRPYTERHALLLINRLAPGTRATGRGLIRAVEHAGVFAGVIDLKRADWMARSVEIGYWAMPGVRGRGVTTEAVTVLTRWVLHDFGFERVELRAAPGNRASHRVAVKAGFVAEGVARSAGTLRTGRTDLTVYSRIRADP